MATRDSEKYYIVCKYCGKPEATVEYRKPADPLKGKPTPVMGDQAPLVVHYECRVCGGRFRTQEHYVPDKLELRVLRRTYQEHELDNSQQEPEPYDLAKMRSSLAKATQKVDAKVLWAVARRAEKFLLCKEIFPPIKSDHTTHTYSTEQIGRAVMLALLDHALITPWARYALVFYRKEAEGSFEQLMGFLHDQYFRDRKDLIKKLQAEGSGLLKATWEHEQNRLVQRELRSAKQNGQLPRGKGDKSPGRLADGTLL